MTDRVLTQEEAGVAHRWEIYKSHERLRAERDLLRAEVKAWRAFDEATEDEGLAFVHAPLYDAATKARAAVDAFDKEGSR